LGAKLDELVTSLGETSERGLGPHGYAGRDVDPAPGSSVVGHRGRGAALPLHILPNIAGLMIVTGSATLPAAILTEAGLSFLGVGVAVGEPSWGGDLGGDAWSYFTQAWWIAVFPGLALSLTVLAFNLLGDSLRDVLDPRLRGNI